MRRRISYSPYFYLITLLLAMMSIPEKTTEKMRSFAVASLSFPWQQINQVRQIFAYAPMKFSSSEEKLKEENCLLKNQIENLKELFFSEERINEEFARLQAVSIQNQDKNFFLRRRNELIRSLELQLQALPAKVIFREPASWSSTLWLNVGEKDNQALNKTIVAKNSPVCIGNSIVGVVEYVGQKQCRIRLLTDSQLIPAVRVLRGDSQNQMLLEQLDAFFNSLSLREDLLSVEERYSILQSLHHLKNLLTQKCGDQYLAKGELYGSSSPLWRSRGEFLKGVGFNYDFADAEGPARDLRSGSLLKIGDLLVTTGLDGIFPPGFRVAQVTKIHPLREGACSYEIEAKATAGNLDELTSVSVLPPLE